MMNMNETEHGECSKCGARIVANALDGLCPKCAFLQEGSSTAEPDGLFTDDIAGPGESVAYIGEYEILETIGKGGMGVMLKARQANLNRIVAIKMLYTGTLLDQGLVGRFQVEAKLTAALKHPNIVPIFEVGDHHGHPFLVMEYVDGADLANLSRQKPLSFEQSAAVVKAVSEAIHYAHQQGILHRDIKPSNILLGNDDRVRITDFGLARSLNTDPSLTKPGQVIGTYDFLPPEQVSSKYGYVGIQSDVYSLGATLYYLLTGVSPHHEKDKSETNVYETLERIAKLELVRASEHNHKIPKDLETICMRCMEKTTSRRYASAQEVADELGRFLRGEPILSRPVSQWERMLKWYQREPKLAWSFTALLLSITLGLGLTTWQWRRADANAQAALQHAQAEQEQRGNAESALNKFEMEKVNNAVKNGDCSQALAILARSLRRNPSNELMANQAVMFLAQHPSAFSLSGQLVCGSGLGKAHFSPDGLQIVTASYYGTVRIWDSKTGQQVGKPLRHTNTVRSAEFSPDGLRVITVNGGHAQIWAVKTGQQIGPLFREQDREILSAHYSPDGKWVITTDDNENFGARIWDAQTAQQVGNPLSLSNKVISACFSPDSDRVVTASDDSTAQIWDVKTGLQNCQPIKHEGIVFSAQFSPDGLRLITVSGFTRLGVSTYEVAIDLEYGASEAAWMTVSDLSSVVDRSTIRIWNAKTGEQIGSAIEYDGLVVSAKLSMDNKKLVTTSGNGTVRIKDAENGMQISEYPGPFCTGELSPDGRQVLSPSRVTGQIVEIRNAVVDREKYEPLKLNQSTTNLLAAEHPCLCAQYSSDGQRVLTAGNDCLIYNLDSKTGQQICAPTPLDKEEAGYCSQFSPDGQWVLHVSVDTVSVWDSKTGKQIGKRLQHKDVISSQFSPDGQLVVMGSYDGTARIWDYKTGKQVGNSLVHDDWVKSVQFSPDGQRIVTASDDRTAKIWDLRSGQQVGASLTHSSEVISARFSPDGQRIVTASRDCKVRIWDWRSGQQVGDSLTNYGRMAVSAQFNPDGQQVLTIDDEGVACIWDTPSTEIPVPAWFPDFLEAFSCQRYDPTGELEKTRPELLGELRTLVGAVKETNIYTRYARKFLFPDKEKSINY